MTNQSAAFVLSYDNGITVFGSLKEAVAAKAVAASDPSNSPTWVFGSEEQLLKVLAKRSTADAIEIFNAFTGVTEVRKFANRSAAAKRIWRECQKMKVEVKPEAPAPAKPAKKQAKEPKPAGTDAQAGTAPREGSKLAIVLEMLRRPGGATLEEIMKSQAWQIHTTRALMSAGGAYAKKYGITVISEKAADGTRTFRVA